MRSRPDYKIYILNVDTHTRNNCTDTIDRCVCEEEWNRWSDERKMKKYICLAMFKHSFVWFVWFVWIYLEKLSIKYLTILTLNHCEQNERSISSRLTYKYTAKYQWKIKRETREKSRIWMAWLLSVCIFRFCHDHSRGVPVHKNLSEACQLKRSVVFHIHHKLKRQQRQNDNRKKNMFQMVYDSGVKSATEREPKTKC